MVVLSIVDGHVNESSVLEVAPALINRQLASPITPMNECHFLVLLASREEVKEVCKLGTFKALTKDNICSLLLAPWSAEIGAEGTASSDRQWMQVWNLSLHGWS